MRGTDYPENLIREIYPQIETTQQDRPNDIEQVVAYIIASLEARERKIIEYRFERGMTLDATSKLIGTSRERVRQIESRALSKMRSGRNIELLKLGVFGFLRKREKAAYEAAHNAMRSYVARRINEHNNSLISPKDSETIFSVTLEKLGLSKRARHFLGLHGIKTAGDIVGMSRKDFYEIGGLGKISRDEIICALEKNHFDTEHLKSRARRQTTSKK